MELFNVKDDNCGKTFEIAFKRARELNTDIVVATTSGATAMKLVEKKKEEGFDGRIIVVSHAYGSRIKGQNIMPEETRSALKESGAVVVTAAHALSGVERGVSGVFKGVYPAEIIASTLRLISAGTKVCLEIALMACDAGAIEYKKPVVCIGGTHSSADTAAVITPSYSSAIFECRINEILCKPDLYERETAE